MKRFILPLVLLTGWAIPGLAHWYYGYRLKAVIFFTIISLCLLIGLVLTDFRAVRYADNPFYYIGQFGSGFVLFFNTLLTSEMPNGLVSLRYFEIGLLYICTAGILNLIIVLNLYSQIAKRQPDLADTNK
jgi:hypothetical protein